MKNLTKKQKANIFSFALIALFILVYAIISWTYKYPGNVHVYPTKLNPIILNINDNLQIRWYAVCVVGGASLLSVFGYFNYLRRVKLDSDTTLTGVTFGIIFGVLGARLYYVLFEHAGISFDDGLINGLIQIINPANGGLAIHGGLYGALIYLIFFARKRGIKFIELIEIVLPVFML